jgi:hypothetical protein
MHGGDSLSSEPQNLGGEGDPPGATGTGDRAIRLQRIFTTWGTVLYVDVTSGELRHGNVDDRPANTIFVPEGSGGRIMYCPGRVGPLRPGSLEELEWTSR